MSQISLLNENKSDFEDTKDTLTKVVFPNIFGINDYLGDSPIDFSTYILRLSFVEVIVKNEKRKVAIFTLINVYENGFLEVFEFHNNDFLRINEFFGVAFLNIKFYSYSVREQKYTGKKISILDEFTLYKLSIERIYELLPKSYKADSTTHNFMIKKELLSEANELYKEKIFNIVHRPVSVIQEIQEKEIKEFNHLYFYGNKNHSFICASDNIKLSFPHTPETRITDSLFLNVYPSLYDSLLDIHLFQKMSNIYGHEEEIKKDSLMKKKQYIYSLKRWKERTYSPSLLTIRDFSSDLRESILPHGFDSRLTAHYNELDSLMMEMHQNELVKGQNELQYILLVISTIALILTFLNLGYDIIYNILFSGVVILLAIKFFLSKEH